MGPGSVRPAALVAERYEVHSELACGGMGVVYSALDRATGRAIALKRCAPGQKTSIDLKRSMLEREYQTLVTLRHPHIIVVHDFGIDALGPYYTMELLDGEDLRAKCPLPWREVCVYLRDVASSLALLHSRRLLHSDVSVANIRLTSEGRAKLFDFGALSSFGRNTLISGAPPTVAPELFHGEELDERVDLYALGGTAYYALCGRHAYPASTMSLLPVLWSQSVPAPPSSFVRDIPAELDELVLSLLALDRNLRPRSAAEVIDRLGAIAGLSPDQDRRVQRSYLYGALVGRDSERERLRVRLKRALSGRGGGTLIEGAPGIGKSALLEDVAQAARLAGARVLAVNARTFPDPFGTWSALLREAGVQAGEPTPRETQQAALLELSETTPLVLAIDDLDEADPDSLVACASLVMAARKRRVLLLAALDPAHVEDRLDLRLLRERLARVELRPFDEAATLAFVRGLFGEVKGAPRLVRFLLNRAAGTPRAYVEIIDHLIEQGFIRYAEGTWILPDELPELELDALVKGAFARRIARFSPALRVLAESLSPHRRVFNLDICRRLTVASPELEGKDLSQLLTELVREGALVEDSGTYAWGGTGFREALYERLDDARKKQQHARVAETLVELVGNDPVRGFEIGLHFLLAGDERKARPYINRNITVPLAHPDALVESVPDLWELVRHLRSVGASDEDVIWLECELFISAYYLDPTLQDQLAERVLPLLHESVGFRLAERLAPYLGAHLAFAVGMLTGLVKIFTRNLLSIGRGSFTTPLMAFMGACASWSACACFRLERSVLPRVLSLLKIARGFGRRSPVRLLYDLALVSQDFVHGRFASIGAGLADQLERLPDIYTFNARARHQYEAGLQFSVGRNELFRLDSRTLACAERIDALGARYDRLMSQYLRRTHHLYRGELNAAKREEDLFDQMAATFGSRWVADVMAVLEVIPYHLSGDVLALKRTLHRIEQLVRTIAPNLGTHREIIRAMYEGHRGRPDLALEIYASIDAELAPFDNPMWATARGHQAECFNALGQHVQALAVCEAARSRLTEDDRAYVLVYQQLERESALALAKLRRMEEAQRIIDTLLDECGGHDQPLVVGLLHYDRARLACLAGDRTAFEQHREAATRAFSTTENPALLAKAQRLSALGRAAGLIESEGHGGAANEQMFSGLVRNARAEFVLSEIVEALGAHSAHLYLVVFGMAVLGAKHGQPEAHSKVFDRDIQSIARALHGELDDKTLEQALAKVPADQRSALGVVPLLARLDDDRRQLVGLLMLGDCDHPEALAHLDLAELALKLVDEDGATELVP